VSLRDRVCAKEVWVELLGGAQERFTRHQAAHINSVLGELGWPSARALFGPYGRQRGYLRPADGEGEDDESLDSIPF